LTKVSDKNLEGLEKTKR